MTQSPDTNTPATEIAEATEATTATGKPKPTLKQSLWYLFKLVLAVNTIIALIIVIANSAVLNALAGAANYGGAGKWFALIMSGLVSLFAWIFVLFFFEFVIGGIGISLYMVVSGAWTGKRANKASAASPEPSSEPTPATEATASTTDPTSSI